MCKNQLSILSHVEQCSDNLRTSGLGFRTECAKTSSLKPALEFSYLFLKKWKKYVRKNQLFFVHLNPALNSSTTRCHATGFSTGFKNWIGPWSTVALSLSDFFLNQNDKSMCKNQLFFVHWIQHYDSGLDSALNYRSPWNRH